jgi:hypothetical protein
LYSAEINKALFEEETILSEISKIEKDINSSITRKLKDKKTILLEKSTLKKLKQLYKVKDKIKPFETVKFTQERVTQQEYLAALLLLSDLGQEIERLKDKNRDIQDKIFSLKNEIQKVVPDGKDQSLLSKQLKYAFYKISQEKIKKSLKLYSELFESEFKNFVDTLEKVEFKINSTKKIIKTIDKKIDRLNDKKELLDIDKDSEALREDIEQKVIIKKEKKIQKESDITINQKLEAEIYLALKWLKEKKEKRFLKSFENIKKDIELLSDKEKSRYTFVSKLILSIKDIRFDTTSVLVAKTEIGLKSITEDIDTIFNKTLFIYEEKAFSLKTIFTFIMVVFVGFIIAKIYKMIVDKFRKTNRIKSLSTARRVANSGYYIIILSTFFIALKSIGLNLHTIFLIAGAVLLWIALGLQGFISNYAMGVLIRIDRSIRIGDQIELDANTIGTVDDMDFRSVTILTGDNTRITIPNTRFISSTFINHSIEEHIKRMHIEFSADNRIDHKSISNTILFELENSSIPHIKSANKRAKVILTDVNRKIVRYTLLVWVDFHGKYDIPVEKSKYLALIHQSLKKVAL